MAKIMLDIHDDINELKDGDILVYDAKTKTLKTFNVNDYVKDILRPFEKEKQDLKNQLIAEKNEYKAMLNRMNDILSGFEAILRSSD